MTTFLIRRLGKFAVVGTGASFVLFLIFDWGQSDSGGCRPLGSFTDPKQIAVWLHGPLNGPIADATCGRGGGRALPIQYFVWITDQFRGHFGDSDSGFSVLRMVADALPATLFLVLLSIIFTQLVSLPLAFLLATRDGQRMDRAFNALSHVGLLVPTLAVGLVILFSLTVTRHWLPVGNFVLDTGPLYATHQWYIENGGPWGTLSDLFPHAILPVLTLSSAAIAFQTRFARTVLDEVLDSRHARNGRSAGLRGRVLLVRHALRQAAPDIIRSWARGFPALLGAIILTEQIFSYYAGLGFMFFKALGNNDFAVLNAAVVMATVLVLVVNLGADTACAWLDPKIRRPHRGVWVANIPPLDTSSAIAVNRTTTRGNELELDGKMTTRTNR